MIISERIQQLRKAAGYSQEKLAELLHVTRQAVSKWESGTTLPTLDNLTELSKVFHISIGELLQIQEEGLKHDTAAASPEQDGIPDDSSLSSEILKVFLQENEEQLSKREKKFYYLFALVGVAIIFIAFLLVNYINGAMDNLKNQVNSLSGQISSIQFSIPQNNQDSYSNNSASMKANSIVSDYSYEVTAYDPKSRQVTMNITATPKVYNDRMTAQFTASSDDMDPIVIDGTLSNSNIFSCTMNLPVKDEIKLSVSFKKDDEIQSESLETIYNLKANYCMNAYSFFNGTYHQTDTSLTINGEVVTTIKPGNSHIYGGAGINNLPVYGSVQLVIEDKIVDEFPIDLKNMADQNESEEAVIINGDGSTSAEATAVEYYFYTQINDQYAIAKDSDVKMVATITDNYGVEVTQTISPIH